MADGVGKPKQAGLGVRLFMTLFCGVFLAMGVGFFAMLASAAVRHAGTYFWHEVPCTIVESRIVDTTTVEGGAAGWHVRFVYQVDGHDYTGSRLSVNNAVGDARDDLRRSQQLAPGTTTTCLVNPGDPTDSVLERESVWVLLTPLFPLVFVAFGAGGIWLAWARSREKAPGALTARATKEARSRRGGQIAGLVFGGVFLLVGVTLTHMLVIKPLLGLLAARSWPAVPCEVVSSEVESHDSDDGTTYSVEITYRYIVDGRTYLSNRTSFVKMSTSGYREKADIVAAHPPGARVTCYVNPADPTDAVLWREWQGAMWFGLIPLVFALVGGGLILGIARSWRAQSATPTAASLRAPAATAPGAGAGRVSVPAWIPEFDAGPVELTPSASRGGRVVAMLLVALFWKGIVSVFLVQLFRGGWDGFDWFLGLFLTPFVAVGLFLIGMFLRQLLALSNPVPVLTLPRRVLRPGERLEVGWRLQGRVHVLRHLRISLEGREEATYRRGTNTVTDKAVFATVDLLDTAEHAGMAAGRTVRALPARLMHSFSAANNKIVWALRVRGTVPRWPDVDEEFVITIAPPAAGESTDA